MMTEDEAKTKTCPKMTYCVNESGVIQDGQSAIYSQSQCIGSGCMAWRQNYQEYETHEPPLREGEIPIGDGWVKRGKIRCCGGKYGRGEDRVNWTRELPRKGYCGAFGSPAT